MRIWLRWGVVGLGLLGVFGGARHWRDARQSAQWAVQIQTGDSLELSCNEILRVAEWSEERYGGRTDRSLKSPTFAAEVAREMARRLDPGYLLLLASDVEAASQAASGPWESFLRTRDCGYFTAWLHRERARLRDEFDVRMETLLGNLPAPTEGKVATPKSVYQTFSADEAERARRWDGLLAQVLEDADAPLLAAYGGDRKALVRDTLLQAAFPEEFSPRLVLAKAILGAMDPFSTYFSSDEFEEFYQDLSGGVCGVGVRVRRVPRGYFVESVIDGSPAAESGRLKEGDVILSLNGQALASHSDREAKNLFKGPAGSEVELRFERPTEGYSQTLTLQRRHFDFQEARVSSRVIHGTDGRGPVAVVGVPSFYGRGGSQEDERSSAEDFEAAVKGILEGPEKVSSLVLDLRGNPGGYLEEAVSMAGVFLGNAPVVAVVEPESRRVLRDDSAQPLYEGPLVVLVDDESASASEVLAGALKDHQRGVLVGTPSTYGKGSVQKLFHLEDQFISALGNGLPSQGVVKLTTSVFYSPLGHTPANGGVQTHIATAPRGDSVAPRVKVQDLAPIVDPIELTDIHQKRILLENQLGELRAMKAVREKRRFSPGEAAKGLEDPEGAESMLDEAVSIAADLLRLQGAPDHAVTRR